MGFNVRLLATGMWACLLSGQSAVSDTEVKPLYFEQISYPTEARITHVQGVVVVRVDLDDEGKVVSANPVYGAKSLLPDCLANAKKWRFEPNKHKQAVIVYDFRIAGLCSTPCPSQFLFEPPNHAVITAGERVVEP